MPCYLASRPKHARALIQALGWNRRRKLARDRDAGAQPRLTPTPAATLPGPRRVGGIYQTWTAGYMTGRMSTISKSWVRQQGWTRVDAPGFSGLSPHESPESSPREYPSWQFRQGHRPIGLVADSELCFFSPVPRPTTPASIIVRRPECCLIAIYCQLSQR